MFLKKIQRFWLNIYFLTLNIPYIFIIVKNQKSLYNFKKYVYNSINIKSNKQYKNKRKEHKNENKIQKMGKTRIRSQ